MPIIRINLLPPEKRRRERTPLSRFVALIVGTAVNAAIVVFMVKLGVDTRNMKVETQDVQGRIATTKKRVEPDYDKTKKQVDTIAARKKAIDDLKKEKIISWYEVVDAVCDVVNDNQWVWITAIDMGEGTKGPRTGGTQLDLYLVLSCTSTASEEDCKREKFPEVMTKFKRDVWDKFKVGPGADPAGRKFPFDYADEDFPFSRKDTDKYRESVSLDYKATVGRRQVAAKPAAPGKKP